MSNKMGMVLAATFALAGYSGLTSAASCPIGDYSGSPEEEAQWSGVTLDVEEGFENATLHVNYDTQFSWGASRSRSIVRDDQYIVWKGSPKLEGPITSPARKWEGFTGSHALLLSYKAGDNGFAEQRFPLGRAYPDLWVGYWLRVPLNWEHGSGNTNNKFFAIWMDEYERVGPTGVIQTRNSGGDSVISPYVRTRANKHLGEESGKLLIDSSNDRGRWMQVVIHVKMSSGGSNADGKFELYRRWADEEKFENIFAYDDWDNYHVGGNRGFSHGYLMGWANATQPYASEWLIDDFVVSEESLLGVKTSASSSTSSSESSPSESQPKIPHIIMP